MDISKEKFEEEIAAAAKHIATAMSIGYRDRTRAEPMIDLREGLIVALCAHVTPNTVPAHLFNITPAEVAEIRYRRAALKNATQRLQEEG